MSTMPIYAQTFCTLSELDDDLNLLGSEREARVLPKLKTASDMLLKLIGAFLPVTMTRKYNGHGKQRLEISPLLSITSIVNNGTTLAANDYIARPEKRYWPNGPYAWLDVDVPDSTNLSSWLDEDDGVEITGEWGMYDLQKALGVTLVDSQSDSITTANVTDGSKVSPGMVIVIGTEQEYVESTATPTASVTTITEAMDSESQSITLALGTLVNVGETIRIGLEQMQVTDISGNQAAVIRGWNKTIRATHADNATVDVYRTFNVTRGVNGTTAAAHVSGSSLYRQCVPDDINMLCRKIAGRLLKDAQGGFSGVIGDPTMGQAQYLYIMPKEMAEIKNAYRIIRGANY